MRSKFAALLAGSSLLAIASPALAQDASEDEIVVTGTSIRGVAPAGAQVISMDTEDITATGATSTSQVLAHIPQLSDFGGSPAVFGGNNFQLSVNRPTLRNLGSGVASTAATLFLMDGHRLPGSGVLQTFPDPDVIPSTVIQRVEVVPDGGSSIYGSDAVAGVVNFITRDDFDGVQVDARYGFGDGFESNDLALTLGQTWDDGSVFVAYSYVNRDPVAAADRDYVRDIDWVTVLGTETRCATPNVTIGGVTTALGGGPAVTCDRAREGDLFSGDERHSVLAGFRQELGANLDFNLKGWYTARDVESNGGPQRAQVTVAAGSPFSVDAGNDQTVQFSFAPVRPTSTSLQALETWGFSPEIAWDLGRDWQLNAFLLYGVSTTSTHNPTSRPADIQAAVSAAQVNPYDLTDPARLANVNTLLDTRETRGYGRDQITQSRAVFDGPLFSLPGGEVRLAVGAEYFTENFQTFSDGTNDFIVGSSFTTARDSRDVSAQFAELNVPIVGGDNRLPLVHYLDVSLSVRHDDYSDFGEVTTQRYGVTYEPVDWISISGHWGDSFQAPGLADLARSGNRFTATTFIPNPILIAPSDTTAVAANGGSSAYNFFAVQGTNPNLLPQEAEAWSVGFDVTPPILDNNLSFGATYWNIDYALRIGSALSFISQPSVYDNFADKLLHDPAGISYATAVAMFPEAATLLAGLESNGQPLYSIYDFRNTNTGGDRREGVDVRVNYEDDTPFGTWYARFNGTNFTNYQVSTDIGVPFQPNAVGTDAGVPDWRFTATLGATVGEHWLGQLTWNHTDGTTLQRPLGTGTASTADDQSSIEDFDTFDMFLQYDVRGTGIGEDLIFTLGVTNLTDEEPPILRRVSGQSAGFTGSTFGRIVQVGVSKHF